MKSQKQFHAPSTSVEVPIIDAEVIIQQRLRKTRCYCGNRKKFCSLCRNCIPDGARCIHFFCPGVAIVYLVSQITDINAPAAWIFSAILSLILWIGFKLKVKGLVRTTVFFLGFCTLILGLLFVIYFTSDTGNIFGNMANMLSEKSVP
jgi:hypothetical protein